MFLAEFELRPARAEDAKAIRDLIHRVQINPMGLDWRHFVLAVNQSGRILGCGQLKPHGGHVVELASIAVEPEFRGRGIARAVIEYLMAQAPRPLFLVCLSSMGPFYEKWGFREVGLDDMPAYFRRLARLASLMPSLVGRGEGLLVMKLL